MEKVNPNVRGTPFGVSFRGGMMFTGFFGDLSQRTKKGKYIHILIHIYIYSHNKNRNDNRFHTMMAFNLIVVASNLIAMASKLLRDERFHTKMSFWDARYHIPSGCNEGIPSMNQPTKGIPYPV